MAETRSLHRKLAQVAYEAARVPKNGTAPAVMGGYKFVQVGDAADFVRKALAEKVLTMVPTHVSVVGQVDRPTAKGGTMTTVDLLIDWTITDGESGESIVIQSFGAGADGGDKYSGKATTSAMKYALLSGFLLSTGEDSELGTVESGRRPSPPLGGDPGVRNRAPDDSEAERQATDDPTAPVYQGPWSETGRLVVRKSGPADGLVRQEPAGPYLVVGFATVDQKELQVAIHGQLAQALVDAEGGMGPALDGLVCTVEGDLFRVPWRKKGVVMPPFQRLVAQRIRTDRYALPAPEPAGELLSDADAELDALLP